MSSAAVDDVHLPPRYVVENYRKAYLVLNGCEPSVRYMGNQWYSVNGETVHRSTIMEEIQRLRSLAQTRSLQTANKSVIQKLIARLKAL
jgi:hypothetical protein